MKWNYIKATDFCESVRDGTHDTPKPVEYGYKLVTGKHIRDGVVDPDDAYYISEHDYKKINERSKVDQWDVLMSMIGNGLGRSAVVSDQPEYAIKNIALFKVGNEVKAKWLHYYLSGPDGQGLIYSSLQGSGQPFISLSYLRDFPIPNPPIEVIEKVVSILEKYDALIENNRKKMKLLEEAAQRLYKEWFVALHFPGYQDNESVPDGWHMGTLSEIANFKRGKTITKAQVVEGSIPVVAGGLEPAYYHNVANTKAPVVTVSGSGANAGFSRLYYEDVFASDCSYVDMEATDSVYYVYCFLKANKYQLDALQKGSAQPHVYAKDINAMEMLVPPEKMIRQFCDSTEQMFKTIGTLQKQNDYAAEARERLIPRLMSGEIEL